MKRRNTLVSLIFTFALCLCLLFTLNASAEINVASVSGAGKDTTYYSTVQAAIDAAAAGDTVKMLADSAENVTVATDDQLTLDLNGYVLKGTGSGSVITNNGTLEIKDSGSTAHYFKVGDNELWTLDTTATSGTAWEDLTARPSSGDIIKVTGGCITGGSTEKGGGIYNNGTLTLSSGSIVGNTSSDNYSGGGMHNQDGTLNITGGAVLGNLSTRAGEDVISAGGVHNQNGTLNITGGTVGYNTSCSWGGGVASICKCFNLTGGTIIGNKSNDNGGGVYIGSSDSENPGLFTMTGGIIKGNETSGDDSPTGGGIGTNDYVVAKLLGGTVTGNKAQYGGGVESGLGDGNQYILGGDITITGNTMLDGTTASNMYFYSGYTVSVADGTDSYTYTDVDGKTKNMPAPGKMSVGITTETAPTTASPVAVTGTNSTDYSDKFTSDREYAVVNEDNIVKLSVAVAYIDNGTGKTYYSDLQTALDAAAAGTTEKAQTVVLCREITYTVPDSMPTTGNCYMFTIASGKTVTLDLNGYTINYKKNSGRRCALFYAQSSSTFTVKNGTILGDIPIGTNDNSLKAFFVDNSATLNIQCNAVGVGHVVSYLSNSPTNTHITVGDGTDKPVYFAASTGCFSINTHLSSGDVTIKSPLKFLECYPSTPKVWAIGGATFKTTSVGTAFKYEPSSSTYESGISLCYTAGKTTAWAGKEYSTPFEVVKLSNNMTAGIYRLSAEELTKYVASGYVVKKVSTPTGALSGGTWYEITPFNGSDYTARTKVGTGDVTDGTWSYFTTLQAAINAATDSSATAIPVELMKDANECVTVASTKNISLDLNGHVLKGTGSGSVITNSGSLTVTDSDTETVHYFTVGSNGLWTLNTTAESGTDYDTLTARPDANAVIAVKGGCITGGNAANGGGINSTGNLTISNGNIIGNYATSTDSNNASGAGVFFKGTTLTMTGGRVIGNATPLGTNRDTSGGGAGGIGVMAGTFNFSGGTVSFNTARFGAGVRLGNGENNTAAAMNMSGTASITCNHGNGNGAGVQMHGTDPQFTMTGGTISGNTYTGAGDSGAYDTGVMVFTGDFIMTGDSVTADDTNGAAAVRVTNSGAVTLGGTAQITGNKCGLYLDTGKTVTISTATVPTTMNVGVTTQTAPTAAQAVAVTGTNSTDYSDKFTSDVGYAVINENNVVKLLLQYKIDFYPNGTNVTCGGEAFAHKQIDVKYGDTDALANVPTLAREGYVFMGWTDTAGGSSVKYTTEELATLSTAANNESISIFPVWGIEVGVPVYVALTEESDTLPYADRKYSFELDRLTGVAPMPEQTEIEISAPTSTGVSGKVGYGPDDEDNPWRMQFAKGVYRYYITQISDQMDAETIDHGRWVVEIDVLPDKKSDEDVAPKYRITMAEYDGAVDDLTENSFDIVKKDSDVAAAVQVKNGKTSVVLGGNTVVKGDAFNTAVIKGKFAIDFTKNFQVIGSLTPPPSATPDGTCVGFMPINATVTASDLTGGGNLGYIGSSKFARSLVLDFDPYNNDSTYGDPGYTHFALTQTSDSGWPIYSTIQAKNVASKWPTNACQYTITNKVNADDNTKGTLTFEVTLNNGETLEFVWNNPISTFKSTEAYFFMSGVVRRGTAYSWGLGAVGSTAPSLTMNFDSFYYLGEEEDFDDQSCLFLNSFNYVAKIVRDGQNVSKWTTVQKAINATASGDTVVVLMDVAENLQVASDDKLTLDLNGCTVGAYGTDSNRAVITNNGDLTLVDTVGGGKITDSAYGVKQNGTMAIGGKLNISGNTSGNLYLSSGKTVTISETYPPEEGMSIGVSSQVVATERNMVPVTNANDTDYTGYFTSDNTAYKVYNIGSGENQVVKLGPVCQARVVDKDGNETFYRSLITAGQEAPEGSTVYVLMDISGYSKSQLQFVNSCTVDLCGHKLSGSDVLNAANGATVKVINGEINSVSGTSCVGVVGSGTLYVEDVVLSGNNAFYSDVANSHTYLGSGVVCTTTSIYSSNGSGILHITDGEYTFSKVDATNKTTGTDKLFITGGCYSKDISNYVKNPPYSVEQNSCTDTEHNHSTSYYTVKLDEESVYVEVKHTDSDGNETVTKFTSLDDAINAADKGDVITLTEDITENVTVPNGKDITIDLNGNKITAADDTKPAVSNLGTLTVTDSEGGGNITGGSVGIEQKGTLEVGGKLNISGNKDGNVYLPDGKTVNVSEEYPPEGMKVGITTEKTPTDDSPIPITGVNDEDVTKYFTSDEGYFMDNGPNNIVVLMPIRKITLTSSTVTKIYDGQPLTGNEVVVTSGTFADGDTFTFECTGSMTEVGCAVNTFTYELCENAKDRHYEITCEYGMLTVSAAPDANLQPNLEDLKKVAEALEEKNPGKTISVYMVITRDIPYSHKRPFEQYTDGGRWSVYYDAQLFAVIDGVTKDIGSENDILISVTSNFYYEDRQNIHTYRSHNGEVDQLTTTPNADGEYVTYDTEKDKLIVTAMKYSTFCNAWKGEPPRTGDDTNVWLYAAMAVVSMAAVCAIIIRKKRVKA